MLYNELYPLEEESELRIKLNEILNKKNTNYTDVARRWHFKKPLISILRGEDSSLELLKWMYNELATSIEFVLIIIKYDHISALIYEPNESRNLLWEYRYKNDKVPAECLEKIIELIKSDYMVRFKCRYQATNGDAESRITLFNDYYQYSRIQNTETYAKLNNEVNELTNQLGITILDVAKEYHLPISAVTNDCCPYILLKWLRNELRRKVDETVIYISKNGIRAEYHKHTISENIDRALWEHEADEDGMISVDGFRKTIKLASDKDAFIEFKYVD